MKKKMIVFCFCLLAAGLTGCTATYQTLKQADEAVAADKSLKKQAKVVGLAEVEKVRPSRSLICPNCHEACATVSTQGQRIVFEKNIGNEKYSLLGGLFQENEPMGTCESYQWRPRLIEEKNYEGAEGHIVTAKGIRVCTRFTGIHPTGFGCRPQDAVEFLNLKAEEIAAKINREAGNEIKK